MLSHVTSHKNYYSEFHQVRYTDLKFGIHRPLYQITTPYWQVPQAEILELVSG